MFPLSEICYFHYFEYFPLVEVVVKNSMLCEERDIFHIYISLKNDQFLTVFLL